MTPSSPSGHSSTPSDSRLIAIVGMGGIFPEAPHLQTYWDNILSKKDCIGELPDSFDLDGNYRKEDYHDPDPSARDKTYARKAGYLPQVEFDPLEFGIPPNSLESVSQVQLLSLVVARDTLMDAGFLGNGPNSSLRSRTGVVLGVAGFGSTAFPLAARLDHPNWMRVLVRSGIPEHRASAIVEKLKALYPEWNEDSFPGFLGNVVAGRIANRFDLGGLNCTVDAACAGSLGAVNLAVGELLQGNCDAVLAGGAQVENDVMSFLCFSKTPALSFEGVCRPYDADSDGMLLGAGIGMMVLKRLEDAQRDGDGIYAVIRGIGTSSDGRSSSIYAPHTSGQLAALRRCYEKASVPPGGIQLLEGHGTGTRAGDACEIAAILEFFAGVEPRSIALGSVKSQIGHLRAAAGAAGMIKVVLALHHKVLPPTLHIRNPHPRIAAENSPFYLCSQWKPWEKPEGNSPRRGAVSAFGFGGANFHIIVEEYPGRGTDLSHRPRIPSPQVDSRPRPGRIEPDFRNVKNRPKIAVNGFCYLNPSTKARRDRALRGEDAFAGPDMQGGNSSSEIFVPPDSPQGKSMEKPNRREETVQEKPGSSAMEMSRTLSDRLEWQESVDRVQSQFHENQAGYIDLLSRYMEKQFALVEKISSSPHLGSILDSFAGLMELLDRNQQRYHDNHDRYLQNQLRLLTAGNLAPGETPPAPMSQVVPGSPPLPSDPRESPAPADLWKATAATASHRQLIPLRPVHEDDVPPVAEPYFFPDKIPETHKVPETHKAHEAPEAPEVIESPGSMPMDNALPTVNVERIMDRLRDIVSDKTGYPKDMIELDMDLEADLGVDSIKWLEILGAMQEEFPDMPLEVERVAELTTLEKIAAYLERMKNDLAFGGSSREELPLPRPDGPSSAPWLSPVPGEEGRSGDDAFPVGARFDPEEIARMIARLRVLILERNGYPPEMLTEDADMDSMGLDVVQWLEIIGIIQEEFPSIHIDLQEMEHLSTLREIQNYLCGTPASAPPKDSGGGSSHAKVDGPPVLTVASMPETTETTKTTEKSDHGKPEPPSHTALSSPYQVVLGTAALEAEEADQLHRPSHSGEPEPLYSMPDDSVSTGKRPWSVVGKYLDEPDRMLSIPAENQLWLIMDEGEGVGEKLAHEMREQGAGAVLLAFPETVVPYSHRNGSIVDGTEQANLMDRIVLPGCDEEHCRAALDLIREKHGPIQGFVYLHPFGKTGAASMADMFREEECRAVQVPFWIAKHLRLAMPPDSQGGRAAFMAVARMDGELGMGGRVSFTLLGGCLSGLIQCLRREWPEVFCRFLDIAPEWSVTDAAAMILKELADPEADLGEVGYDTQGKRRTWKIVGKAPDSGQPHFVPHKETVFLVSGGGRGITAECVVALAEAFQGKFILLGRTPAPGDEEDEPQWARDCPNEQSLKERIIARLKDQGQRAAPVEVDRMVEAVSAQREIRETLRRIEQKGGEAVYFRADVTDGPELREVIAKAREKFGEIAVLIHGAGNLADKKIQDKTPKDFERVFACKVQGLKHLSACLDFDRLRSVVLFSSVVSLWGNAGQTDYAMANAALDKFARCSRLWAPEKMITAIHWGPWDHGMVTPFLKKIYREKNIGLLSRAEGSRMCVELFKEKVEAQTVLCENIPVLPFPTRHPMQTVRVQRTLDPQANPFLRDHVIDGRPVLPATCAVHWMVQTCEALLPGHGFGELREFKVLKGIVFQQDLPRDYIVQVEPTADRPQPTMAVRIWSRAGEQTVHHYSAEIVLCPHHISEAVTVHGVVDPTHDGSPGKDFYSGVPLFHGASFQGIRRILDRSPRHITVSACLPPLDASIQGQFKVGFWNPYIADVQLQSILLWSAEFLQAGCLPSSIGRIVQFRPIDFGEDFHVSVHIQSQAEHRLLVDMTAHDAQGRIHMQWTGVELTVSRHLHEQFLKNRWETDLDS